jgi:uncharacterized protein HemX
MFKKNIYYLIILLLILVMFYYFYNTTQQEFAILHQQINKIQQIKPVKPVNLINANNNTLLPIVPEINKVKIINQLNKLQQQIYSMPFNFIKPVHWQKSMHLLSQLIIIRHDDKINDPIHYDLVRNNIILNLQIAQLAIMQDNMPLYKMVLQVASDYLIQIFAKHDYERLIQQLRELQ